MTHSRPDLWSNMAWNAAPQHMAVEADGTLFARSGSRTDFWQKTFYGFERDDGHAFLKQRSGDFTATLSFEGDYRALYDQAGLMMRQSPSSWIKFGVEFTDGAPHLSVVVTNGTSDWSARPVALEGPLLLRATRLGSAVLLQHGSDAAGWQMARLAPFTDAEIGVGPYLCSPERAGFEARFHEFNITDPQVTDLHS